MSRYSKDLQSFFYVVGSVYLSNQYVKRIGKRLSGTKDCMFAQVLPRAPFEPLIQQLLVYANASDKGSRDENSGSPQRTHLAGLLALPAHMFPASVERRRPVKTEFDNA